MILKIQKAFLLNHSHEHTLIFDKVVHLFKSYFSKMFPIKMSFCCFLGLEIVHKGVKTKGKYEERQKKTGKFFPFRALIPSFFFNLKGVYFQNAFLPLLDCGLFVRFKTVNWIHSYSRSPLLKGFRKADSRPFIKEAYFSV